MEKESKKIEVIIGIFEMPISRTKDGEKVIVIEDDEKKVKLEDDESQFIKESKEIEDVAIEISKYNKRQIAYANHDQTMNTIKKKIIINTINH